MTTNNIKTINHYVDGENKHLLYKTIGRYNMYLMDFSFEKDNIKYNINMCPKGFEGEWFIFSIDGKKVASDNVWVDWKDNSCDNTKQNFILKKYLKDKPADETIKFVGLNLFSKKKRQKIKKYIIKKIEEENKRENDRKERNKNKMKNHKKICCIGLESDEYVLDIFRNIRTKEYELYCTHPLEEPDIESPRSQSDSLETVLMEMMDGFMTNSTRNFYDCTVYDKSHYELIKNSFYQTEFHRTETNPVTKELSQAFYIVGVSCEPDKSDANENEEFGEIEEHSWSDEIEEINSDEDELDPFSEEQKLLDKHYDNSLNKIMDALGVDENSGKNTFTEKEFFDIVDNIDITDDEIKSIQFTKEEKKQVESSGHDKRYYIVKYHLIRCSVIVNRISTVNDENNTEIFTYEAYCDPEVYNKQRNGLSDEL